MKCVYEKCNNEARANCHTCEKHAVTYRGQGTSNDFSKFKSLTKAIELQKWGAIETWYELTVYERKYATQQQREEIRQIIKRKNSGERITLPYMNYKTFSSLS